MIGERRSYIKEHPQREKWLKGDSYLWNVETVFHILTKTSCIEAETILDLGTGRGALIRQLRQGGKKAYGIDLRIACSDGLIVADAGFLPFNDSSFDLVIDSMLLNDFKDFQDAPEEAYNRVIGEVKRVLKPEGNFLTSFWRRGAIERYFCNEVLGEYGWGLYRK